MPLFEQALIAVRFVHFCAELFLFGGLLFPLYSRLDDTALLKGLARQLEIAAALAALSALAWLACVVASMGGAFKQEGAPLTNRVCAGDRNCPTRFASPRIPRHRLWRET